MASGGVEPIGQPADGESRKTEHRREVHGERVVVDPLQDAGAVFAWLGESTGAIPIPEVVPAQPGAIAGLLTHLHRDHADAAALSSALGAGATVRPTR